MRQACAKSSTEYTHTLSPSLLSQKSFQHPSLFADIVRGAQVNCVSPIANCATNSWFASFVWSAWSNDYKTVRCTTDCCCLHNCQLCQHQWHTRLKKVFSVWSSFAIPGAQLNVFLFPLAPKVTLLLKYTCCMAWLTREAHSLTHSCNVIHC
jgi:hypothetical protein